MRKRFINEFDRYSYLIDHFGLSKTGLLDFWEQKSNEKRVFLRNKVNRFYKNKSYPKEDRYIVEYIYHAIPYGFSRHQIQDFLIGRADGEKILMDRIRRIEGTYQLTRFHSETHELVNESLQLHRGRIIYQNYRIDETMTVFEGKMVSFEDHYFFETQEIEGYQRVYGVIEQSPFTGNLFAGMIMGLTDGKWHMATCKIAIKKLSHDPSKHTIPPKSQPEDPRLRELLSHEGGSDDEESELLLFSSRSLRQK